MELNAIELEEVDSTNSYALSASSALPLSAITVIAAKQQSSGRGRYERRWASWPGASLLATFALFVDPKGVAVANIPQLLALSAVEVARAAGAEAAVKWPNDIVAGGKKLGGILTETKPSRDLLFVACGIGLNVNMGKEECSSIGAPATSLFVESGSRQRVEAIKLLIVERFAEKMSLFLQRGFSPFVDSFRGALYTPTPMHFTHGGESRVGLFSSINDDGSLSLLLESGEVKSFTYGEVT